MEQDRESGVEMGEESEAAEMSEAMVGEDSGTSFTGVGAIPPVAAYNDKPRRLSASDRAFGGGGGRGLVWDAGPQLINAIDSILGDDSTDHINALIAQMRSALSSHGIRNTTWAAQLLFQFRGAQQHEPGDLAKFIANVKRGQGAGALGPNGARTLVEKASQAAGQKPPKAEGPCVEPARDPAGMRTIGDENIFASYGNDTRKAANPGGVWATKRPYVKNHAAETNSSTAPAKRKEPDVDPKLEAAIKISEYAASLPGLPEGVKAAFEAINNSLELAKNEDEQNGAKKAKHVFNLGSAVMTIVGELVKYGGRNVDLAAQACEQLGKIGTYVGFVGKYFGAVDDLSKVLNGKTMGGKAVDANERMKSALDLIGLAGGSTVGFALTVSRLELEWIFNHIGVPVKEAIENAGIPSLFGGKSADAMRGQIEALSTDDSHAIATVQALMGKTFGNHKSMFSQQVTSEAWRKFWLNRFSEGQGGIYYTKYCNEPKWRTDSAYEAERPILAQNFKDAALRFIDKEVNEARSWAH